MNKQSNLQTKLIKLIDNFCGIKDLISFLKRHRVNLPPNESLLYLNMIHYYESLYRHYVPAEDDIIMYRAVAINHLNMLRRQLEVSYNKYIEFLVSFISFSLDYTKGVRLLA